MSSVGSAPASTSPAPVTVRDQLVAYFESRRKLVAADALRLLVSQPWPLAISQKVIEEVGPDESFVTLAMVQRIVAVTEVATARERPRASVPPTSVATSAVDGAPVAPVGERSFSVVSQGFSAPPTTDQPLAAYAALFAARYKALARHLKGRATLPNLVPVAEASDGRGPRR